MTEHPRSVQPAGLETTPNVAGQRETLGRLSMRSPRGFVGSIVLVLALPVTVLIQVLLGNVPGGLRVPGRRTGVGRNDAGGARQKDLPPGGCCYKWNTGRSPGRDRTKTTHPKNPGGNAPGGGRSFTRQSSTLRAGNLKESVSAT